MQPTNIPYTLLTYAELFDSAGNALDNTRGFNLGFPYLDPSEVRVQVFEYDVNEDGEVDENKIDIVHSPAEFIFPKDSSENRGWVLNNRSSEPSNTFKVFVEGPDPDSPGTTRFIERNSPLHDTSQVTFKSFAFRMGFAL